MLKNQYRFPVSFPNTSENSSIEQKWIPILPLLAVRTGTSPPLGRSHHLLPWPLTNLSVGVFSALVCGKPWGSSRSQGRRQAGRQRCWGIVCAAGLGLGQVPGMQRQCSSSTARWHNAHTNATAASCRAAKAERETACSPPLLQLRRLLGCWGHKTGENQKGIQSP